MPIDPQVVWKGGEVMVRLTCNPWHLWTWKKSDLLFTQTKVHVDMMIHDNILCCCEHDSTSWLIRNTECVMFNLNFVSGDVERVSCRLNPDKWRDYFQLGSADWLYKVNEDYHLYVSYVFSKCICDESNSRDFLRSLELVQGVPRTKKVSSHPLVTRFYLDDGCKSEVTAEHWLRCVFTGWNPSKRLDLS